MRRIKVKPLKYRDKKFHNATGRLIDTGFKLDNEKKLKYLYLIELDNPVYLPRIGEVNELSLFAEEFTYI